jgi:crotonobetainyl-CoA:carnitine CoA-transferase CaiB-like acyl-CoA transferase
LPLLKARFAEKPTAEWAQALALADVLHAPVNDHAAFLADPQVAASGLFAWGTQPGMGSLPLPHVMGAKPYADEDSAMRAPALGEHGRAVLEEIGFDKDAIERLHAEGVVCSPAAS